MRDSLGHMEEELIIQFTEESILRDYRIAFQSREASLLGRREVLTGKAKFGIFGAGKEVAQVALAKAFRKGDFRSGYYRDQTLMMALGMLSISEFFAQLYADTDLERDPASGGRQMNCHFATRMLSDDGEWKDLTQSYNSIADLSPTGSQMPRLVGLAYASHLYRELDELKSDTTFSNNGNEIAFGTIGDASCAEGMFWESVNAAGALRAPMLLSIWDDAYGISVPTEFHITKGHLSTILRGFQREPGEDEGYDIYTVRGWDYPALCETYLNASSIVRREHVPAIIHVTELTQPQGHSTSGSHERYKSQDRLEWEAEYDCLRRMRQWVIDSGIATDADLEKVEQDDRELVRVFQRSAWDSFREPYEKDRKRFLDLAAAVAESSSHGEELRSAAARIERAPHPLNRDFLSASKEIFIATRSEELPEREALVNWTRKLKEINRDRYCSDLYSSSSKSALQIEEIPAKYDSDSSTVNGYEVLNSCFDAALSRYPNLFAFGEDVGNLGDVNQGLAGLQEKYGRQRVADTGIREVTIIGQAIGMALRGLRPIAEVQYLDYVLYALQIMSDDLASLRWRTKGGQKAPVIVRTRGHRLEGVWHSGSPMAGMINLLRGMYVCVPRNMTQAAGMYNTLLKSDDPAIVVEVLSGYRLKERLPSNTGEFTVPLGIPEVLREGRDVTLVTYGACCRIALEAAQLLSRVGIEVEIIDAQTLVPFDRHARIVESVKRTHRLVCLDEDVPGGATSYMLQMILEEQAGFHWLDAEPRTISAKPHRPAYGSDGDYFSKPSRDEIFDAVYELMATDDPGRFPSVS